MTTKVDITNSTFIRLILILLGLGFLFLIRDVVVLLFIVLIIVAGLSPTVERWAKTISRPGAVVAMFVILLLILSAVAYLLVPPLARQLQEFTNNLPTYTQTLSQNAQSNSFIDQASNLLAKNLNSISGQLSDIGGAIFSRTVGVISGVVAVLTVFVLTFYLLLDEEGLKKLYKGIVPNETYNDLAETTRKIAVKLGAWLRAQLLLMVCVGVLVTIGLVITGTPYALSLGIWAGITEVVPMVGPWIGAVPGAVVGLAISPLHGLLALIIYALAQQIESNFLVPRIMGKAVGLNPVIVIVAILIGGKLYGILGILLAVPLAAVISVIAEDWLVIRETFTKTGQR